MEKTECPECGETENIIATVEQDRWGFETYECLNCGYEFSS